jgi:predicted nucleotidyltransferase
MSTYKINFKQLRQEGLKELFDALERSFNSLQIDFYIIGALARDTWFAQKGIRALGTKDVDLAIFISSYEKYDELKEQLITKEQFVSSSSNEYVLFDRNGIQIDLLPFGAIDLEGRKIIDHQGTHHSNILGFKEVYEEAVEEVNFENRFQFKVSTLPGIVILKFIAYDDRPEIRSQDIKDIYAILSHYFDLETDLIYEKHADLFEQEAKDLTQLAARALGREMKPILDKNTLLKGRLVSILKNNTNSLATSVLATLFQEESDSEATNIQYQVNLLKEIIAGIEE